MSESLTQQAEHEIIEHISTLSSLLDSLDQQLQSHSYWHQLFSLGVDGQPRKKTPADAALSFSSIWHLHSGDGRETSNLYGAISCASETIALATHINGHKAALKKAITAFYIKTLPLSHYRRQKHLNELLSKHGMARLHLQQAYRLIPILDRPPSRISFSWYNHGKSIKRISLEDAQQMLLQLSSESDHIQSQLQQLSALTLDTQLAQVQEQAPLLRANITWKQKSKTERKARNCPLPFLFESTLGAKPDIIFPKDKALATKRHRQQRADAKLSAEPLLPSIRVYSYKN